VDVVITNCCKKLFWEIHYEARIQAVRNYHATVRNYHATILGEARTIYLTPEQYIQVKNRTPWLDSFSTLGRLNFIF
jgi:hypothetical protein